MQAGKLNRYVQIQKPAISQDVDGQPLTTWTKVANVWADVRYLNGAEAIRAGQDLTIANVSIRIRKRDDVTASMRAVLGATVFNIRAVLPDEETGQSVDLVCQTGSANG